MTEWAMKRFWTAVEAREAGDGGFGIFLDGRPVNTPGKARLRLPTAVMAERVAEEWDAQQGVIRPETMPWTKSANSAIDKVAAQRAEVEAHLAEYAGTDLLAYRAEAPEDLAARQAAGWDPLLDWTAERFGARIRVTRGVMPVAQEADALARLAAQMAPMSDFHLTGFHDLVTVSGSYVLALAAAQQYAPSEALWELSRVDELWQIEQWGRDEEAEIYAQSRKEAFLHANRFFHSA